MHDFLSSDKMLKNLFLFFSCLSVGVFAKHEVYDGHSLYEVTVKDVDQAKIVNGLEHEIGFDVWSHAVPARPGQILVAKHLRDKFESILESADIQFKVEVENIIEKLDLEDKLFTSIRRKNNGSRSSIFPLDDIHRYDVIDEYITELARRYPEIVTVVTAGRSFEGREIKYLKISTTNFQDRSKPIVMMQSLLHCREWVGLAASLYAIQKLVVDVTEVDLLQNIDWIITPIANPDGYEHTHTDERFWRKNRATDYFIGDVCMGVDLNRNFDSAYASASSSSPCSDTFHGSRAFSEPETALVRDIILEHVDRLELFLDIHSFGSWILYGYGNGTLPSNALYLNFVGVTMAENIDRVKLPANPNYIVGNVFAVLYAASGSTQDWAQEVGVTYSYTLELPAWRNSGTLNGFLVDPEFIEQAGFETWQGIKAAARLVARNYRRNN